MDKATIQKLVGLGTVAALGALAFYFSSDPTVHSLLMNAASLAIGAFLIKRPGDEAPPTPPSS